MLVAGGYDARAPGVCGCVSLLDAVVSSKDNTRDVDTVEHLDPWQSIGCALKQPSTSIVAFFFAWGLERSNPWAITGTMEFLESPHLHAMPCGVMHLSQSLRTHKLGLHAVHALKTSCRSWESVARLPVPRWGGKLRALPISDLMWSSSARDICVLTSVCASATGR